MFAFKSATESEKKEIRQRVDSRRCDKQIVIERFHAAKLDGKFIILNVLRENDKNEKKPRLNQISNLLFQL